jgi:lysophospholipase L1-like esterase
MFDQADLPEVGSKVTVESLRRRGYVQRLHLALQVTWPHLNFVFDNRSEGGATSRTILACARHAVSHGFSGTDVAFLSCGINDVWRTFQGQTSEAVGPEEFNANYREIVRLLTDNARQVICMSETPIGWDSTHDAVKMNAELSKYNAIAAKAASDVGAQFLDVWPAFMAASHWLGALPSQAHRNRTLWSDGVHLSELGDALILQLIERHIQDEKLVTALMAPGRR